MKDNRYKSAMDKIKCSREFHAQMTKMLTMSDDGFHEYIDTVGRVEVARPGSRRYVVVSAAACIAICAVGFGFWKNSGNRDIRNSTVEIEGNNPSDNPIILPSAAQPETTSAEASTSVKPKDVSEESVLIDSVIDNLDSGELQIVYVQAQYDDRYSMSYNGKGMKNFLALLGQRDWTKKTIEYDERTEYYSRGYLMGNVFFSTKGMIYDNGTSCELFTPANESCQKCLDNFIEKMTIIRCQNVKELLANYNETFDVMSADVEMYRRETFWDSTAEMFFGHTISGYGYADVESQTSGKVYFDRENEYYATQMRGTRTVDGENPLDIGLECASEKSSNVRCLELSNEVLPNMSWVCVGPAADPDWKYVYPYTYSSDSDAYLRWPGDYFGLKASIIRDYEQISNTTDDFNNYNPVVYIDNDENGGLFITVVMYCSLDDDDSIYSNSTVGFVMNEDGLITEYRKYKSGEFTSYKLSNIKYEDFEKPQLCDYEDVSIMSAYGNGQ